MESRLILLTGATGYVGGRLLNAFERQHVPVRALARRPAIPTGPSRTEWVTGDVLDEASLRRAMTSVRTAYYLIHSMAAPGHFPERDRDATRRFAAAARASGVERIIYLGGLGGGRDLSEHLASRQEVGRILRESGVPVVEFRASIIVGAGNLSHEIVRSLVDKLPVMITPRWVTTLAQPIAIGDVVEYLQEAAQRAEGGTFEIGGSGPGVVGRNHEGVRTAERMPSPVDPRPGPEPRSLGPLAPPDGSPVRARRPRSDRRSPERDRGPGHRGAVAVQGPPARHRRGDPLRPGRTAPGDARPARGVVGGGPAGPPGALPGSRRRVEGRGPAHDSLRVGGRRGLACLETRWTD